MTITVTQVNPFTETVPHAVTNAVIKPTMQGNFLEEMPADDDDPQPALQGDKRHHA
jgi:hypothetical protein